MPIRNRNILLTGSTKNLEIELIILTIGLYGSALTQLRTAEIIIIQTLKEIRDLSTIAMA